MIILINSCQGIFVEKHEKAAFEGITVICRKSVKIEQKLLKGTANIFEKNII